MTPSSHNTHQPSPPFEAYHGAKPYLFVSYAHADFEVVYPELERLHQQGLRIWYDEGIKPGSEWPEDIAKALETCSQFLVFISPHAIASKNVRNEINFALDLDKPFLAVHLEETSLPGGFKLQIGSLQAILKYYLEEDQYHLHLDRELLPELRESRLEPAGQPGLDQPGAASQHPIKGTAADREEAADREKAVLSTTLTLRGPRPQRHSWLYAALALLMGLAVGAIFLAGSIQHKDTIQLRVNPRDGARMVLVPQGKFIMGSENGEPDEKPQHQVYLEGYWIYQDLVTVAEYRKFCKATGRQMPAPPAWGWKDNHPMINVNWSEARAYSQWAGGALPTEAQWENAARDTDGREYPWGNRYDSTRLRCSSTHIGDAQSTAPVGSFPSGASPYGALDMAGNAWQWCADWYGQDYASSPERSPTGPEMGTDRAARGGCWADYKPDIFRSAHRTGYKPEKRDDALGFRCVLPLNR